MNGPEIDLNLLRAGRLYSDSVPLESVQKLVEQASRTGGWLVFYTHDVRPAPSRFGCTPEYFEASLRCVKDAGARILTVADAVSLLTTAGGARTS